MGTDLFFKQEILAARPKQINLSPLLSQEMMSGGIGAIHPLVLAILAIWPGSAPFVLIVKFVRITRHLRIQL